MATRKPSGEVRIGISGWRYEPWRKVFYPDDLPQRMELHYASRHFNSIEINGTFYSLQRPAFFRSWYEDTPDGFEFSVKGGRYITHLKRLRDVDEAVANFFASGVLGLEDKLGPILWQFPASLDWDLARFEKFFSMLPHDASEASKLAAKHSDWMSKRAAVQVDTNRPIRHAVEVRSPSFEQDAYIDLLRKHGIASVVADAAGRFPYIEDVTSDFMYLRLHGEKRLYESGYTDAAIDRWAKRIDTWRHGGEPKDAVHVASVRARAVKARDVFVYFDNDVKVRAPFDAAKLAQTWAWTSVRR